MRQTMVIVLPAALLIGAVSISYYSHSSEAPSAKPGLMAPAGLETKAASPRVAISWKQEVQVPVLGPSLVDLSNIPTGIYDSSRSFEAIQDSSRMESRLGDEEVEKLRQAAALLPPSEAIQTLAPGGGTLTPGISFDSMDFGDCCGGGQAVPPDPDLAVGFDHIVAAVNVAFSIYDTAGVVVAGPTTLDSFFAGTSGYPGRPFDPSVHYDESTDRWFLGVNADNTDFCFAVTTSADPTSTWNRYCFAGDIGGALFDYPQTGVGAEAILVGSNQFTPGDPPVFLESRVFAIDKSAAYAGAALGTVNSWSLGGDATPQPANLHGWHDGAWPSGTPGTLPHWVVTDQFDGCTFNTWTIIDPLADPIPAASRSADIDLCTATGVAAGMPIDWPQADPGNMLQANDWRARSAEFRNDYLWLTDSVSCNPGAGSVNCVRWAQIDPAETTAPAGTAVLDAGVVTSDSEFRTFPSINANRCDDAALGYSKGSAVTFPSTYVTGRESGDPAGMMQPELALKDGDEVYDDYNEAPHRWGDYTGMAIDPDGVTFWYLGQYSKTTGAAADWGTYLGSFSFVDCEPLGTEIFADGFESGNFSQWSNVVP